MYILTVRHIISSHSHYELKDKNSIFLYFKIMYKTRKWDISKTYGEPPVTKSQISLCTSPNSFPRYISLKIFLGRSPVVALS